MEWHQLSESTFQLRFGNNIYLTIVTSLKDEILTQTTPETAAYYGWIVRGGNVFPWKHELMCIDETVHIIGPYLNGTTLAELLANGALSFGYISRLTRAFSTLENKSISLCAIHAQAIVFLDDGGILFLANEIVTVLCKYQESRHTARNYQPFNHPMGEKYHYTDEDRYSFALAVISYCALCGRRPWDVESDTELKWHMISGILPTVHFYDPYIRPDVSVEIHNILSQPRLPPPPLKFWENFFRLCFVHGTHTTLSEQEAQTRKRQAHVALHRLRQARARKLQLRTRSFRLLGTLLFVLLLVAVPYALIHLLIDRPSYRQLSAEQVVERYYDGIDTLNRTQVIETLHPEYLSPSVSRIDTIYRASRLGMIFRLQNPYLDPQSWIDSGRPRIGARYAIYGIDRLQLTELTRSEHMVEVAALYWYWIPERFAYTGIHNDRANSTMMMRRELLSLQMLQGRWVITAVEPL